MAFEKITESVLNVSALADTPDISAEDLKETFDEAGALIKNKFNTLIDDLIATSGASEIGASALATGDTSNANIQAKLVYLLGQINGIVLGQIPDNSITEVKLLDTYSALLAKKNGDVQTNLNSHKLGGKTLCDLSKINYIECSNTVTEELENNITANIPDFQYVEGAVVNLKMPNNIQELGDSLININGLGNKSISDVLNNASRQYVYNGTSFELYSSVGATGTCTLHVDVDLGFTPAFVVIINASGAYIETPTTNGFNPSTGGIYIAFR